MAKIDLSKKANMVKEERKKILDNVVSSMIDNFNILSKYVPTINPKLTKATDMISDLTVKLVSTNDIEEINKIRNRINYYINRIKSLTHITNNDFYDKLFLFRDDIKEYVRIKRRNIINVDTNEYSKEVNKELNKEKSFNKRLQNKYSNTRLVVSNTKKVNTFIKASHVDTKVMVEGNIEYEEIDRKNIIKNTRIIGNGGIEYTEIKDTDSYNEVNVVGDIEYVEIKEEETPTKEYVGTFEYVEDLHPSVINNEFDIVDLNAKLIALINTYKLVRTNNYENNAISNIKNLIINIPKYLKNKKAIKKMEKDYATYYHGRDLYSLIRYTKYDNSFIYAIGDIFKSKDIEVERTQKYRKILESIYDSMVVETYENGEFKYLSLKKISA